eukprot:5992040-Pyramimonas_sp.AAC.1
MPIGGWVALERATRRMRSRRDSVPRGVIPQPPATRQREGRGQLSVRGGAEAELLPDFDIGDAEIRGGRGLRFRESMRASRRGCSVSLKTSSSSWKPERVLSELGCHAMYQGYPVLAVTTG